MPAFLVNLCVNKLISVRDLWVRTPVLGEESLVFYSPNENDDPDFKIETAHYFASNVKACYKGRVQQKFGMFVIIVIVCFFQFSFSFCTIVIFITSILNQPTDTLKAAKQWLEARPRRITNIFKRFPEAKVIESFALNDDGGLTV